MDALKRDVKLRRERAEQAVQVSICPMWKPNCQLHPDEFAASARKDWSGREDLNLRPPGPEAEKIKNLSASFGVA